MFARYGILVDPAKWISFFFGVTKSGCAKYPTIFMICCKSDFLPGCGANTGSFRLSFIFSILYR
jgi:hypothetical protein